MPEGGSPPGFGFEAGLGFSGGSRFGVGLGLGPRRLQARNPQQGSDLPEGLSGVQKGRCRSGSVFGGQGHTRRSAPGQGGPRIPLGQLQSGLGSDMLSCQVPCRVSLHRLWTPGAR